jgi:hypothetical protein
VVLRYERWDVIIAPGLADLADGGAALALSCCCGSSSLHCEACVRLKQALWRRRPR